MCSEALFVYACILALQFTVSCFAFLFFVTRSDRKMAMHMSLYFRCFVCVVFCFFVVVMKASLECMHFRSFRGLFFTPHVCSLKSPLHAFC